MKDISISKDIIYIGADDKDIDLFESQYIVPNGISYNSYLIKDEKNVVMDTIDKRKTQEWIENLEKALNGEKPDYLVVSHLEPDHAYNIELLAKKYPEMKLIGNNKTFAFMPRFFDIPNLEERKIVVKEGDEINIGKHTLQFFMAPMVHWPEVMVTYEKSEKIVFSADGFGKFGALDTEEDWACEARRYYFGIVGQYGIQVQSLLKKLATLEVNMICPLHGPILKENLGYYIDKYNTWSSYTPEDDGVFVAYASIHGNTAEAAKEMAKILEEKGAKKVAIADLSREDWAECIEDAFRYDKLIIAASSYNAGVFTPMEQFLNHLKHRNYQNRKIGIIENGTWAPSAARCMKEIIDQMKNITVCENIVTIESTVKPDTKGKIETLADEILGK
ncbi:MAG: FprA family A-type flavoprotein [Clostridia bacterium]|nr:FprA family A-type flavoprotein [Clostridia bacterium]